MALQDVKPNSSGGKGQARFCRRAEAKAASKKIRRQDDAQAEVVTSDDTGLSETSKQETP